MQTVPEESRSLSDVMKRRPMVSAALFLIVGIVAHERLGYAPGWWMLIGAVAVGVALVAHRRESASGALAVALVMGGIAAAQVERFGFGRRQAHS